MENCMNYIIKICFVFSFLLFSTSIKSFDDMQDALQHMHHLFEEDSALLELYNTGNAPTLNDHILSDNELEQFGVFSELWDTPLFEDFFAQNIPDLSTLAPSSSSAHETFSKSTALSLQTAASSLLRVQEESRKKKFSCEHPGCLFATKKSSHLKDHKHTHTGEKQFACDYSGCTYATAVIANLTRHKRTHTGEKPYKCGHLGCKYATGDKSALARHKQSHARRKPFACDHPGCTHAASDKSNLTKHKNSQHLRVPDQEPPKKINPRNKKQRRQ